MSYLDVRYYLETFENPEKIAEMIANMQSTGTWKELPEKYEKSLKKYKAKVKFVKKIGKKRKIELPTRIKINKKINCADVVISYPVENFGDNITLLLTTVAGEIFDMSQLTAIKVIDINFTDEYLKFFKGPKFGIDGIREITGVKDRPFFGGIIKPCVGLSAKQIAGLTYKVAVNGADFIKDDELLGNMDYNTVKQRAEEIGKVLKKVYEKTGKKVLYAINVTDYPDRVFLFHDIIKKYGAGALLFNVLAGGFSVLKKLADYTELPIHCHRDFSVATFRCKYLGITSKLFTKIVRICGGDMIQCGGIDSGYLFEKDEEVLENFSACTQELSHIKKALPVSSGGQWAGKIPVNLQKIKNNDFLFLCGGGIFTHPDGPAAGIKSIYAAYEITKNGEKIENSGCKELKNAIKYFGKGKKVSEKKR
jgi:ribulose-bisphosphate carboxylase large chain